LKANDACLTPHDDSMTVVHLYSIWYIYSRAVHTFMCLRRSLLAYTVIP